MCIFTQRDTFCWEMSFWEIMWNLASDPGGDISSVREEGVCYGCVQQGSGLCGRHHNLRCTMGNKKSLVFIQPIYTGATQVQLQQSQTKNSRTD